MRSWSAWAGPAAMARPPGGLQVVGLERGPDIKPRDFAMPGVRDELRYMQRLDQIQDRRWRRELRTGLRSRPPMRRWVVPAGNRRRRRRQPLGATMAYLPTTISPEHIVNRYGQGIPED